MKEPNFIILNQKLEDKVPPDLQSMLDIAFALTFEKGTGVIDLGYSEY